MSRRCAGVFNVNSFVISIQRCPTSSTSPLRLQRRRLVTVCTLLTLVCTCSHLFAPASALACACWYLGTGFCRDGPQYPEFTRADRYATLGLVCGRFPATVVQLTRRDSAARSLPTINLCENRVDFQTGCEHQKWAIHTIDGPLSCFNISISALFMS
ncbi:uncharacterized protein HD556DRAFT_482005 [Suillus plorans]|uniref:Uncharacterized protein n=1 Tax=Suillus plorans TaxID=116603 RepID=A0A9P7DWA9_9AGAM|nr:uncharacterized protein HD556DRAFT_482005 [Suillus plorans]KAG1804799.1 hypothetical protein HD556DRAFT_482005 [Suillus plorans]